MIKESKKDWDEINEEYVFTLEGGDKVVIPESEYDKIQLHTSANEKKLKAIVNEHKDNHSVPIEYLGFEPVK